MVSGTALFISMFNNLALLIILVAVFGFIINRFARIGRIRLQIIIGITFGLFVYGCMHVKIPVYEGVFVDQRNAIVILAGVFGGPLAAFISAIIGGVYRIYLGGIGIYGGEVGLTLSAIAGSVIFLLRKNIDAIWKIAIYSVTATVFILPGFLPLNSLEEGWKLLKAMTIPYGTAILIGIFIGSLLLKNENRRFATKEKLKESEKKYRELFESLVDVSYKTDIDGTIIIVSPSIEKTFGFKPDEVIGRKMIDFYQDPNRRSIVFDQIMEYGFVNNYEMPMIRKDGAIIIISTNARLIKDDSEKVIGIEGVARDVTKIKKAEEKVLQSLAEKESLLMEIYHRTKNNMQVISSFLNLQAAQINDAKVNTLVRSVSSRILAMSLVHEKLYRSKNLSRINIREYIEDLVALMMSYHNFPDGKVTVLYDIEEVNFVIDTAIPLGLVIQEIVTNSLKHAFPGDREGVISIKLSRDSNGSVVLTIIDNGVGMPIEFDADTATSFGINTTLGIIKIQMHGTVDVINNGGVSYNIVLKGDMYEERI
jgi:PAS domain S-box-containing protein